MDCPNENTISAFATGRLPRAEAEAIQAHARDCARCPARLAAARAEASGDSTMTFANVAGVAVRPRFNVESASGSDAETDPLTGEPIAPEAALERGASIGRYTILGLVGKGGMGEVYAAYDPELDRKIALKLLRARSSDPRSRARLLREAKAIAKLSHANVVVVHDAGTFEQRVFIAMEFVDGQTLKEWLAETPRRRREILEVFGSAARGLQAAHVAGLVHRDFKPHNVMVGRDGSVRVMDFGVAREVDAPDDQDDAAAGDPERPASQTSPTSPLFDGDLTFTRTGELVGTPMYMAPEQFQATRTDARTDQFSFCVALYQALYRRHPFAGGSMDVLVGRVLKGDVQPAPGKHDVPAWLRRVLLRGLAVAPADRWPSMAALLEALDRDPARARRRWGAAAGVALLVGAAVFTLVRGAGRAESLCRGGPARLADFWELPGPAGTARPRRDALAAAFTRAGGAAARDAWTRVEAGLDRYAASFVGMYRDACEATHARGEQSPQTLELRMACLDERRAALGALTTVLASADTATVAGGVDAVNALPPVDRCGDIKLLREPTDSPRDEATRARAQEIQAGLATAKTLHLTGRHADAMKEVRARVGEARQLGTRSLLAEALDVEGDLQDNMDFQPQVVDGLEESVWLALAVKRDDLAARAAALLATDVGYLLGRVDEGWRWARLAGSLLDRMGPGQDLLRAWLLHDEGNLKLQRGDLPGALELYRAGLSLKEKVLPPDHPDIALSLSAIAEGLHRMGNDAEALEIARRTEAIAVRAYGPAASVLSTYLSNQGEYLVALGRAKEAVPVFEDSLARFPAGAEPPGIAYPLTGLGQAWLALGRAEDARPALERALRIRAKEAPDAVETAETRFALARALWASGTERPRARELARAARETYARVERGDDQTKARATTPPATLATLATLDAWLSKHE